MKIFLKVAVFVLAGHLALAQDIKVGVKGSLNFSNITKFKLLEKVLPDFNFLPTAGGGVFAEIPLTSQLSFRPEVNYTEKGSKLDNINLSSLLPNSGNWTSLLSLEAKIILRYIDVPLLLKYNITDAAGGNLYIIGGPGISFKVDDELKGNVLGLIPANMPLNLNYNKTDFSGHIGAGYEFPIGDRMHAFLETRYQHGFSNILKDVGLLEMKTRNRNIGISAGVSIPLGK